MNLKTTYILFGVLALVLGVLGVTLLLGPSGQEDTSKYVLPSLNDAAHPITVADIATVILERSQPERVKLVFVRDEQGWKLTEPYEWRADGPLINEVIFQVLKASREDNAALSPNLQEWGLETPLQVITLKNGSGQEWKLNLGNERPGTTTGAVYVTSSDHPKEPMAVKRSELDSLFKSPNDYRARDLLAQNAQNILYVKLEDGKHGQVILEQQEGAWRFAKPPQYGEADYEGQPPSGGANAGRLTGVRDLLNDLEKIRVEANGDFVADNVHDWGQYGLATPALQITVKHHPAGDIKKEPLQATLLIGKKADDKGEKFYARLEGTDGVVRVPASNVEPLLTFAEDPSVLRSRDLVHVDQARVDAVNIKNADGLLKLRRARGAWRVYDSVGKGADADNQAVQKLLGALTTPRQVVSFPDPAQEATLGFDHPAAVISVWVEGLQQQEAKAKTPNDKKDEKKTEPKAADTEPTLKEADKPTIQLSFGKKEDRAADVLRVVGGSKMLLAVPDALLETVQQGRLAYLDRTLPSFSVTAEVTRLTIDRGGKTYELVKDEKKPDAWALKEAPDTTARPADRRAVERIIDHLRELTAERLVKEGPPEADLQEFGLKQPRLKAVVTVRTAEKKSQDFTYLFGKDTQGGVYAEQGSRALVFIARPQVVADLQGELRDRQLFHFQPAEVKEVRLTGWKPVYKTFSMTLDLERQADHAWKVKQGPENFKLNQDATEAFLRDLTDADKPLVERFLDVGAKPEYKLGKDERALEIELTVGEEKSPQTLTIGALDSMAKAYYAQSSTLPNQVFLVPQDRLEKLLRGVESFSHPPK